MGLREIRVRRESCGDFFNFMMIFGVSAATIGAEPEAHYIEYFADEKERGRSCCIVLAYDVFLTVNLLVCLLQQTQINGFTE